MSNVGDALGVRLFDSVKRVTDTDLVIDPSIVLESDNDAVLVTVGVSLVVELADGENVTSEEYDSETVDEIVVDLNRVSEPRLRESDKDSVEEAVFGNVAVKLDVAVLDEGT